MLKGRLRLRIRHLSLPVERFKLFSAPLLDRLNQLTRADITTRNRAKAGRLERAVADLEARIERLREQEELERIRPAIDGHEIMAHLGLEPGPLVGEAWNMLKEARLEEGPMPRGRAFALLDAWAREKGLR
jgi:poly(A) polymerase